MKEEIKKLWVDALCSGEYKQGREKLKVSDTYCCLGVLCELHRLQTGEGQWTSEDNDIGYMGCTSYLPDRVVDWAGLHSPGVQSNLVHMNDGARAGFKNIAEYIEKRL